MANRNARGPQGGLPFGGEALANLQAHNWTCLGLMDGGGRTSWYCNFISGGQDPYLSASALKQPSLWSLGCPRIYPHTLPPPPKFFSYITFDLLKPRASLDNSFLSSYSPSAPFKDDTIHLCYSSTFTPQHIFKMPGVVSIPYITISSPSSLS